jgi:N4-gp56 family major capsid protein
VSNSVASLDVFTVTAAAPAAFQSGDQVRIVSQNALTAASVLSTKHVAMAQRDLVNNRAMMFGSYYGALISPYPGMDFKRDTTWTSANQYSNISELWRGEIGRWFGFRFVETTQPGREDTDGTENRTSGNVFHTLFFGRNAFGHTELQGANQRLIYVNQGPDKKDPLDMYTIVGWKQIFAIKALTAPHCVSVMSGATA